MIEANLWFSGCSCGCTSSCSVTIRAETQEDLDRACVSWACQYRVDGQHPFRKVHGLPSSAEELGRRVIQIMDERNGVQGGIDKLSKMMRSKRNDIERIEAAAKLLGIEIPDGPKEQISRIEAEIATLESEKGELSNKRDEINMSISEMLKNDAETTGDEDEDEDEDEDY